MNIGRTKIKAPVTYEPKRRTYRCTPRIDGRRIDLGRERDKKQIMRRYVKLQLDRWHRAAAELDMPVA